MVEELHAEMPREQAQWQCVLRHATAGTPAPQGLLAALRRVTAGQEAAHTVSLGCCSSFAEYVEMSPQYVATKYWPKMRTGACQPSMGDEQVALPSGMVDMPRLGDVHYAFVPS